MRIGPAGRFVATALLVIASLACARPVRAQQGAATPGACVSATGPDSGSSSMPTRSTASRDTTHAMLRVFAAVSADEMRFVGSPKVCVRLTGDAQLDSVRLLARRNLATPVVSNTTYRNVYVAVEILGRLNAECIAARITGTPRDSATAAGRAACASIGIRDSTGARQGPP